MLGCLAGQHGNSLGRGQCRGFLASDEASYITSLIMPVDGGLSSKIG